MIGSMFKDNFVTMKVMVMADGGTLVDPNLVPSVPASSPVGTVTAPFGSIDSVHHTPHSGIDYACPRGIEIHAPVDGVVSKVVNHGTHDIGKGVYVKMEDGQTYVVGHLDKIKVNTGDPIHTGDVLGLSGNTGHSTGPHLHFGAFDQSGHVINPGNIPWNAFQGTKEAMAKMNDLAYVHSSTTQASTGHGFWGALFDPVGDSLKEIFLSLMHLTPMMFTVIGLVCFMLTMMLAHSKPYWWGVCCWAISAIARAINYEMGN